MGIDVYLETEDGTVIAELSDPQNIIKHLIPLDDAHFPLLRYVDLYGDTVFNRLQMDQVLAELKQLKKNVSRSSEEVKYITAIEDMAHRCRSEPHLYLKFRGD